MSKACVIPVLFLFLQTASLQLPKVEIRGVGDGNGLKAHDIHVECPNGCLEKVYFELNCSSGTLSASRLANDYIDTLEQKVNALEHVLALSGLSGVEATQSDITSRVLNMEKKVDRVVQCLLG